LINLVTCSFWSYTCSLFITVAFRDRSLHRRWWHVFLYSRTTAEAFGDAALQLMRSATFASRLTRAVSKRVGSDGPAAVPTSSTNQQRTEVSDMKPVEGAATKMSPESGSMMVKVAAIDLVMWLLLNTTAIVSGVAVLIAGYIGASSQVEEFRSEIAGLGSTIVLPPAA